MRCLLWMRSNHLPNLYRPPTNPAEKFTDFKKLPEPSVPADEFKAVLKRVQGMEDRARARVSGHTGADPDDEADAVAAALKDVQAAERLVLAAEGLGGSDEVEAVRRGTRTPP